MTSNEARKLYEDVPKDIKSKGFMFFSDDKMYTFTKNRTLIVAPVRWGKTFLLAKIARHLADFYGVIVIFISPNLKSLQVDWYDKHTALSLSDNLDIQCITMKDRGIQTLFGDAIDPTPSARIYSTHKHPRWLKDLEESLTQIKKFQSKVDKKIVFLIDEVHGVERDNASNDLLMKCIKMMSEIGRVIGTTATPHRNLGSKFWDQYIEIDYPEGVTLPHKSEVHDISEDDLQLIRDQICIPDTLVEALRKQMLKNSWNIVPVVGQKLIKWHMWFCKELKKHFPKSLQLRISGGDYVLYRDGVEIELKKLVKDNVRYEKIASVQQAVTALTDYLYKNDRENLDLFVVGHNQIEEGQTHGNFKGDRTPTAQMIITPKGQVFDDRYAQYNRTEHMKAARLGIKPVIFTSKKIWEDNYRMSEWIRKYAHCLANGLKFNEPIPEITGLKSAAVDAGRGIKIDDPEFIKKLNEAPLLTEYKEFSIASVDYEISKTLDDGDRDWLNGFIPPKERGYRHTNTKLYKAICNLCGYDYKSVNKRVVSGNPNSAFTDDNGKPAGNDVQVYLNSRPGSASFKDRDLLIWKRDQTICVMRRLRDVKYDTKVGGKVHDWHGNVVTKNSLKVKTPQITVINQKTNSV